MYLRIKSNFIYAIVFVFCISYIECRNKNEVKVEYSNYDVFSLSKSICKYYVIDGTEFVLLKDKFCFFEDTILNDYNLISPILPASKANVLVERYKGEISIYGIDEGLLSGISFKPDINKNVDREVIYFKRIIIYLDHVTNTLNIYSKNKSDFIKDTEVQINEKDIFNIYGGINSNKILIEAGYFPAGGCEYVHYYCLDLNDYTFIDCTDKILPINNTKSPFDLCYMDINQEYFFFPNEIKINDFEWIPQDDYILNSNFDTVGRALRKQVNYNGKGFCINKNDRLDYYFWQIESGKLVCFPVNINFEKQIYKTYYDSLLIKNDLENLENLEIKLLLNTIILKNSGIVENQDIRDILSVYAFFYKIKENKLQNDIVNKLDGIEKKNYELLLSLN